jgi:hypothetical protein
VKVRIFHNVRWERLDDWLSLGWCIVPDYFRDYHAPFALMCEWLCDCPMRKPLGK